MDVHTRHLNSIFHHVLVRMQIIPNFVSVIGMWINCQYVGMTTFANLFIESVARKSYYSDMKCHMTLNVIIFSALVLFG